MRLAVTGSNTINDYSAVSDAIDEVLREHGDMVNVILTGGAKGVQSCAKEYCSDYPNLAYLIVFEPLHVVDSKEKYRTRNFYTRNIAMLRNADMLLAIWDGKEKNTEHAIAVAKELNIPVILELPNNEEDYSVT